MRWRGPDSLAGMVVPALALLLAACAGAPPAPEAEDAPLPERFGIAAGDDGGARGDGLPAAWWRHFDDPGLNRAMAPVVDDNFSLAAARARLEEARAAARREGGALLPQLDATGGASATRRDGDTADEFTAGAAASYEVDLWGRLDARARAATLEAQATRRDLRAAGISLTAEAATAYYGVLRQRALLTLIEEQARTNRRIEELVALRYRQGSAGSDELLRQRQLIETTRSDRAAVRGELERRRAELAALQGRPLAEVQGPPEAAGLLEVPPLPDPGLPADWLRRRPDLQAAFLRVRAADAELAAAISAQYPRLDLSASLESVAGSPSALFESWIGEIAAGLSVPLFRGGALAAEVERTRAARDVAFNEYADTVLDAVTAVETALQDERTDRTRVASLERQVALGERVLEQLRFRYRNGATAFIDVLDAQTTLQESQRALVEARWALVLDRIALVRAIAGGWRAGDAPDAGAESGETSG